MAPTTAGQQVKLVFDQAAICVLRHDPVAYVTAGPTKNQVSKWMFPAGMSSKEAAASLKEVLDSYPQQGQAGVDLGGWIVAEDSLATRGYARYEYKSGIGNFGDSLHL